MTTLTSSMLPWPQHLSTLLAGSDTFATITITDHGGSSPREVGAKMVLTLAGEFSGTVGGGELERQLLEEADRLFQDNSVNAKKYTIPLSAKTGQCCGGVVEALIEIFNRATPVYIFGAGHVGEQVAQLLQGTPMRAVLVDERPDWPRANATDSAFSVERAPHELISKLKSSTGFYAAIMTHSHDLDFQLVKELLPLEFRYLGLIGSKTKRLRFDQRLTEAGITREQLQKLDCPMGIDLGGGKTPREVAISLSAKLLSVYYHDKRD